MTKHPNVAERELIDRIAQAYLPLFPAKRLTHEEGVTKRQALERVIHAFQDHIQKESAAKGTDEKYRFAQLYESVYPDQSFDEVMMEIARHSVAGERGLNLPSSSLQAKAAAAVGLLLLGAAGTIAARRWSRKRRKRLSRSRS